MLSRGSRIIHQNPRVERTSSLSSSSVEDGADVGRNILEFGCGGEREIGFWFGEKKLGFEEEEEAQNVFRSKMTIR